MGFPFMAGQTHTVPCVHRMHLLYSWQGSEYFSIATEENHSLREGNVTKPKSVVLVLLEALYPLELIDKYSSNR